MFIRFSNSPSFEQGWAIGVQLVTDAPVGPDGGVIKKGFVHTKQLQEDAYVRAHELETVVSSNLTPAVMEQDDLESIQRIASKVALTPGPYPWESLDGTLAALLISAGDTSITAEWNSGHPDGWRGLDTLQSELYRLFAKYH